MKEKANPSRGLRTINSKHQTKGTTIRKVNWAGALDAKKWRAGGQEGWKKKKTE